MELFLVEKENALDELQQKSKVSASKIEELESKVEGLEADVQALTQNLEEK